MANHESTTERDTIERVADSFVARFRSGERPSIEEYAQRYPELADELRNLLPALVMLEENASPEDTAAFGAAAQPKSAPPAEIGDFTIVREIGRGGMGVVYEAVQESLGRHVALKVLSAAGLLNPTHLERFHLEARAAARLHHTHIVPVFGVGEHGGLHYYAMQFIQGQSLDLVIDELRRLRRMFHAKTTGEQGDLQTQAIAAGMLTGQFRAATDGNIEIVAEDGRADSRGGPPLPRESNDDGQDRPAYRDGGDRDSSSYKQLATSESSESALNRSELTSSQSGREFYRSVARVGLQVADALSYAHSEGILHRDIKPSNLLLDARGSVWITDFGLARDESTNGLTRTGDFVGTLRYMAPERLEGWSDRRSDLYSLGATLYELLTLRPFLETPHRGQLVDKILHENPTPPSKTDGAIPRDLETIVLKAIGKEPASRYRTAEAMAEDLERFLADRPILARRSTPAEQFVRWCRRNPAVAGLTGAVAALLVAAVLILAVSNSRIHAEAAAKEVALQQARAEADRSRQIAQFMKDMLEGVGPGVAQGQDTTLLRGILDQTASRVDAELAAQPELEADLRETLGNVYRDLGEYTSAEAMIQRALALRRKVHHGDHPDIARALHQLAVVYWLQVQSDCESIFREALAMRRRLLGPKHRDVADSLYGLAEVLRRDDATRAEAEKLHRDALGMRRELLGTDDLAVADSLAALGILLRNISGRESEGEAFLRDALEIHRTQRGPEHPQVAHTLSNLGYLMKALPGRQAEGESLVREAIAIQRKVLGDHRDTAMSIHFLASMVEDQAEVESLHREALEMRRKVLGDDHADTAVSLQRLADVHIKKGEFADAIKLYRDKLARIRQRHGNADTSAEQILKTAAQVSTGAERLRTSGRPVEAEAIFRETIALLREIHGGDHADIAGVVKQLGDALLNQGRPTDAELELRAAVAMLKKLEGDDHPHFAGLYATLGYCLNDLGKWAEAEESLRKSQALGGLGSWKHGYVLFADVLAERGVWEDVEKFARITVDHYRERNDNPIYFSQLARLRQALLAQGKEQEAEEVGRELSELVSEMLSSADPTTLNNAVWNVAVCRRAADASDVGYAVDLAKRAVELEPGVGSFWNRLGVAYYRGGDIPAAIEALNRARQLNGSMAVGFDGYFLAMAYAKAGNREQAEKWFHVSDQWTVLAAPDDPDFRRWRMEAIDVLGLTAEPLTPVPNTPQHRKAMWQSLLELESQAGWAHIGLGESFANEADWAKAAEHFAQALKSAGDFSIQVLDTYALAIALLQLGDDSGYRNACTKLLAGVDSSPLDFDRDRLAWTCALGPEAVKDFRVLVELSEKAVAANPANAGYLVTLGAVLYRAERYEESAQRLEEAITAFGSDTSGMSTVVYPKLFLSMARWRLGDEEQARQLIAEIQPAVDEVLANAETPWNRRATVELLRNEAAELVAAQESP